MRVITDVGVRALASERGDYGGESGIFARQLRRVRHLEVSEIKAGTNRTSKKGVGRPLERCRGEPSAGGHDILKHLSIMNVSTYSHRVMTSLMKDVKLKRSSRVKMPHLIGSNSEERREVTRFKKIIDTGRGVTGPLESLTKDAGGNDI